jgi:excisionase family DNA binding protein
MARRPLGEQVWDVSGHRDRPAPRPYLRRSATPSRCPRGRVSDPQRTAPTCSPSTPELSSTERSAAREKSVDWASAGQRAFDPPAEPWWSKFARVGGDDLEQAIARLADHAVSLTLDQRLRIAALLARPAQPEATPDPGPAAGTPMEAIVLTVEETAELLKVGRTTIYDLIKGGLLDSIMIGRLRRIRYTDVTTYLEETAAHEHRQ